MTRKAKFVAVTLSVVVLTTGGFLRASQAQESQGQVQPEETPGQVQERAVPGLPMPQLPGIPARPSPPPPGVPGVLLPPVGQPLLEPHATPSNPLPSFRFTVQAPPGVHPLIHFYAEREKTAPPVIRQKLAEQRARIQRDKLRFGVGYTSVAGRRIEEITGLKQPPAADLAAWANQSSSIASQLLRLEQQAIDAFEQLADSFGLAHLPENSLRALLPPATAPAFDWTVLGKVSPVHDQNVNGCGSCWAFASVSALESNLLIRYNESTQLSPQYVMDNAVFGSCNGGNPAEAFTQMMLLGTANEGDVPYHGQKFGPRAVFDNPYRALMWGIVGIGAIGMAPSVPQLKASLLEHGPLAVTMHAGDDLSYYTNGVYSGPPGDENHVVTLVGWDDRKGAWRIKNSWGSCAPPQGCWGEAGFGWVAYGTTSIARTAFWVKALNLNLPLPPVVLHWIEEAKKLGVQFDQNMRAAAEAADRTAAKARAAAGAAQRQAEIAAKDAVEKAASAASAAGIVAGVGKAASAPFGVLGRELTDAERAAVRAASDAATQAAQAAEHAAQQAAQQAKDAWDHAINQVPAPKLPDLPSCCHF